MPGEVREDANCPGDTLTNQSARGEQYQFPEILGDQIPTCHVPHSLSAVMLGLDWPKELGKKLVRRAETPDVG